MDLGLRRQEPGQDPPEPHRLVTEPGLRPAGPAGRGVPLVEDQVEHAEHRAEPLGRLRRGGQRELGAGRGEGPLGADDPLGGGRLRDQERAPDLRRAQAAQQPQGQRDPALHGQDRVRRREDQPQQVVAEVVVEGVDDRLLAVALALLGVTAEQRQLLRIPRAPPQQVDRPVLRGRPQPPARVGGHAVTGPLLQGDDQGVLGQLLGQPEVTDQPGEARDEPRRLDAPDRFEDPLDRRAIGRHAAGYAGAGKSSGPNSFSTSTSPSHSGHRSRCTRRNRAAHSTASSFDRTS